MKGDCNGIDVLPKETKQFIKRIHSFTNFTPIEASLKNNQRYVQQKLKSKRKRIEPPIKSHDPVRTADLRKTFSKSDTTNWS